MTDSLSQMVATERKAAEAERQAAETAQKVIETEQKANEALKKIMATQVAKEQIEAVVANYSDFIEQVATGDLNTHLQLNERNRSPPLTRKCSIGPCARPQGAMLRGGVNGY